MSGQKRKRLLSSSSTCSSISSSSESDGPVSKRSLVQKRTVEEWKKRLDKDLNTVVWLVFDVADRDHVTSIRCSVCTKFRRQLESMRNFRSSFIDGSSNVRVSTVKDHAGSDMHARAMLLYKKQQSAGNVCDYAPIAKSLAQTSMDPAIREATVKKFRIAYFIAKEKLAFNKMAPMCQLEEINGVDLRTGYKNDQACATFVQFIAREQQISLKVALMSKSKFFSIQADASTDAGNVEVELFTSLRFDPYSDDGMVHVRHTFFCTRYLKSGTGVGLFECLQNAIKYMEVDDWQQKVVGFGCDGASANIASGGLKGHLQREIPWIAMFWCLAHRLELSIKDALKSTFFSSIDEFLMRLYYLYNKSPKKTRQLEEIVSELKNCFEPSDMPTEGGIRPLRACGTRFVLHKVAALERVVNRFGAYLAHLISMIEDSTLKAVDRQKLKGFFLKWQDAKFVLGCALFHDLLKPCSLLCKTLQENEVCIVRAIESVMKTKKALDKFKATDFKELPTVKKVLERIKHDEEVTYQGVQIKQYTRAVENLQSHKDELVESIEVCIRNRVASESEETELLTHTITLLATNGWERSDSSSFGYGALDAVCQRFQVPLESAQVDCSLIQSEWDDMVDYAKRYLNLVQQDYKVVWWKIYNCVDAKQWTNVLAVIELLFCLPISNGPLERIFSQLKLIKDDRRTCLGEDTLDQLVRINVEAPPLSQWDPSCAVDLWLQDRSRRVNQKDTSFKKPGSADQSTSQSDSVNNDEGHFVDDWEEWIMADDSD